MLQEQRDLLLLPLVHSFLHFLQRLRSVTDVLNATDNKPGAFIVVDVGGHGKFIKPKAL